MTLSTHRESSARRARAFEAEIRRAKECAQHAINLRDLPSRGKLLSDDRHSLEIAEQVGNKGAETASTTLNAILKRAEMSLRDDKLKHEDLANAHDTANSRLQKHE